MEDLFKLLDRFKVIKCINWVSVFHQNNSSVTITIFFLTSLADLIDKILPYENKT